MKLNKLYIAILLFAGILTSCKVGKSYVRPELHLPDSLAQHQDTVSFGDQDWAAAINISLLCSKARSIRFRSVESVYISSQS